MLPAEALAAPCSGLCSAEPAQKGRSSAGSPVSGGIETGSSDMAALLGSAAAGDSSARGAYAMILILFTRHSNATPGVLSFLTYCRIQGAPSTSTIAPLRRYFSTSVLSLAPGSSYILPKGSLLCHPVPDG